MNINLGKIKAELRKDFLLRRKELASHEVAISSKKIVKNILKSEAYQKAKTLFCYYPSNNECDILDVAHSALKEGKKLAFPKSYAKSHMEFFRVDSMNTFELGRFNIMEPISHQSLEPDEHTLILVPGVAFDANNYRIGYGGGYYDAYFNKYVSRQIKKIGVYYQWQKTPMIPVESHDIALDQIIMDV